MDSYRRILGAGVLGLLSVFTLAASAQEEQETKAKKRAALFLGALGKGDTKALRDCYAPKVLVKGGSELLREKWGLNPDGDPQKDLELDRDKLLEGYMKLIAKAGDRWSTVWSRILKEEGRITFSNAKEANAPFGGVKKGDLVVTVVPGDSDDRFVYVLRADAKGQWWVVVEGADY
ncbi:MAG: hypothetical protein L0Y72_23780 [Gemmataceae bacterium]|nr:hypothetical protein [Gemmataceae bacterium]MCI0742065.1 hypothetical protein [Gemmataceae bacterium]